MSALEIPVLESGGETACQPLPKHDADAERYAVTRNACKLCTPLGACLAFRGVQGCVPFLHGSQGCATYIRRYLISHFREPIDIASSNFHEESAIFGGHSNFKQGLGNVLKQYQPQVVGVATTCLAETIGDDMSRLIREYRQEHADTSSVPLVHVSTASYRGTHMDGFHHAVRVLAEHFAAPGPARPAVNLLPGMLSAGDLRHLKDMLETFGLFYVLLPDYSETMDGETWAEYEKMPRGGTLLSDIALMGASRVTLEFGRTLQATRTAGVALEEKCGVPRRLMGTPIGLRETDRWLRTLAELTDGEIPEPLRRERGRLVDAFIDGHKYVFGRRALVYGEEDLVIGLASLLCEIGVFPVLCASGGRSGCFEKSLREAVPELPAEATVREGCDFATMAEMAGNLRPDFLLGSSKGYSLARQLNVPLVRAGFPIHDRLGGHRLLHVGYRGALELFDRIVNTLLEAKQASSTVGHSYL